LTKQEMIKIVTAQPSGSDVKKITGENPAFLLISSTFVAA